MQVVDVLRDGSFLKFIPWAVADAVARIDGLATACCLRAEIRTPGLGAGAGALRQGLTALVRAFEPAEIGTLAGPARW